MFHNYFVTAFRNLMRNKTHMLINISGLAIGMFVFVFAWVTSDYEANHDRFFQNSERIYGFYSKAAPDAGIGINYVNGIYSATVPLLRESFSEFEKLARISQRQYLARVEDRKFYELISAIDPEFLDIFKLQVVSGRVEPAAMTPNSLILSRSTAEKYFGQDDPIGQVVTISKNVDMAVVGVFEDLPGESHFKLNLIDDNSLLMVFSTETLSSLTGNDEVTGDWTNLSTTVRSYALLQEGADVSLLNQRLEAFWGVNAPEERQAGVETIELRHISEFNMFIWTAIGVPVFLVAQLLGILVLAIGCLNYTNLATATVLGRAREVGIRKTLGAGKAQLMAQFMTESIMTAFFALVLAVGAVELGTNLVNSLAGKAIEFNLFGSPELLGILTATILGVGLVSGGYPAFLLTRMSNVDALKGGFRFGKKSRWLRAGMVTVQFTFSILMVIAAALTYLQNDHMRAQNFPFATENIVVIDKINQQDVRNIQATLRTELERIPGVIALTATSQVPFEQSQLGTGVIKPGSSGDEFGLNWIAADHGFIDTYEIEIVAGRALRQLSADELTTDDRPQIEVLLNQLSVERLGFASPADAVGQLLQRPIPDDSDAAARPPYEIVGVMRDANFLGFHNALKPFIVANQPGRTGRMSVRIAPQNIEATLARIDDTWDQLLPDYPIERRFLEDHFNDVFQIFAGMNVAITAIAIMGIIVAVSGLLGVTAFVAQLRIREVGIRKVLGASELQIVRLLVLQFSLPVIVAFFLAVVPGILLADLYLNFFVDRIELPVLALTMMGLATIALGGATVAGQALMAARTRPGVVLRYE